MAHTSKIEWTEATWNPWHGCHKVSQGCKNCYMFRDKARYGQDPNVVVRSKTTFYDPLKWTEPRTIFTCSWSDFFIEEADAWRDEAFAIMALTPQHTYQVLTKRPERMLDYVKRGPLSLFGVVDRLAYEHKIAGRMNDWQTDAPIAWPLPNVWLGVSVEDRETYQKRVPYLALTPAATRFVSMEPLLGPLGDLMLDGVFGDVYQWAIVGGESGPDARPMHPDWTRSIRDQCTAAFVPFFFKQWGEYKPYANDGRAPNADYMDFDDQRMHRVGKHNAGRILDGRTWDEMPEVAR